MEQTSDERRKVADKLMQMANAHEATEASRVAHALGLEYKVYGTVVAFDSADIRNLADLIDPTCEVKDDNRLTSDTCDTGVAARRDTPASLADELEAWCDRVDVDGDACDKPRDLAKRIRRLADKEG